MKSADNGASPRRLLVTGGGFIGSRFCPYWCSSLPSNVVVVDILTYAEVKAVWFVKAGKIFGFVQKVFAIAFSYKIGCYKQKTLTLLPTLRLNLT